MKTNLDLVNECNTFPLASQNPKAYAQATKDFYTLIHIPPSSPNSTNGTNSTNGINKPNPTSTPIGLIPTNVLQELIKVPTTIKGEMTIDHAEKTISVFQGSTESARSKLVAATCNYWREKKTFRVLEGWRDELYPVYGVGNVVLFSVERAASSLLGVVTYGVHMTAYIKSPSSPYGMKIWVPRRSATKQTYSGLLDNSVAGGTSTGEDPLETLIREAAEEASLPSALVRNKATSHGTVTYIYTRDSRAGGETGLLQPECEYIYDLELPVDVTPKPADGEVDEFYLWTVDQVREAMGRGEFKPNCAMVLLDFFIRHGVLTRENEVHFDEIQDGLHRVLEFPGPHGT